MSAPSAMSADELAILAHEVRSPVAALAALSEAAAGAGAEREGAGLAALLSLACAAVADIVRLCGETDDGVSLGPLRAVPLREVVASFGGGPDGPIVAPLPDVAVLGDPTRLRQAFGNVVSNATRHGSNVTIRAVEKGQRVAIEVHDDGPGVPEGLDVFAKGVSGAGSTGYGLWVARQIVEAHGGTLELVRDDAPGACFRIELPLASASA